MPKIIFEFKPNKGIWVIIPTIIIFTLGSESDDYRDITIAWFCVAVSLRIDKRK